MKMSLINAIRNGQESLFAGSAAALASMMTQKEIYLVICFCVMGGALFGLIGSILAHMLPGPDSSDVSDKKRWLANGLGSFAFGPILTWYLKEYYFPDAPIEMLALGTSGLLGTTFVSLIFLAPALIRKWKEKK